MTTDADLLKAGHEAWYRGSGFSRGADADVLADLGYTPFDELIDQLPALQERQQSIARHAGAVVCADCGQVVPCATHTQLSARGKIRTVGY